ncbi:MAG: methyl-accepting chemotaxis protein [Calditrichaeota bacterium]|nr:MAG: methyl-accepting chemotaxis protein [Calditrichota bacterium]
MSDNIFNTDYARFVEQIRSQSINCDVIIQSVQSQTAGIYETLAEKLPRIIEQIDSNSEEARALVNYFIATEDSQYDTSVVGMELEQARKNLQGAASSIQDIRRVDVSLFNKIQEQVNQIESIHESITSISLISDDIELLSYNSGFVASRAGVAGAAFTYIAAEIKKLSNRTKNLVNRMRSSTDSLINSYKNFNEAIDKINTETDTRLSSIEENLMKIFDRYKDGLKNIASLLDQNMSRSETTKNKVFPIMTSLQDQDIIRQSLEQVTGINSRFSKEVELAFQSMSVDSIPMGKKADFAEEATAKVILLTQLAEPMVQKIIANLEESLKKLVGYLMDFQNDIRDIENDRIELVDFFSNSQNDLGGKSSIDLIFDESSAVMMELIRFIKESIGKKRDASNLGNDLIRHMDTTESCFEEMQDIVKAFSLIKVASKMEIAREKELSRNITTSSEMFEELTNKMEGLIVQLRRQLVSANQSISESLLTLNENLQIQEENVDDVSVRIGTSNKNLEKMRDNLNDAIRSVGRESGTLFELVDDSLDGARKLGTLVGSSKQLSINYNEINRQTESFRENAGREFPVIFNKYISFERFKDIKNTVDRMTVYSDKSIASDALSMEIEEGSNAGDLTLF